jgi:DNA primase
MTPYSEVPERIKREILLSTYIQASGVELKKRSAEWVGLCPFHDEKTPSFSVNDAKGLFFCRGCHEAGDIISFHSKLNLVSAGQSIKHLAGVAGIEVEPRAYRANGACGQAPAKSTSWDKPVLLSLTLAAQRVFQSNAGHPGCVSVLISRNIPPATRVAFGLGYLPANVNLVDAMVATGTLDDLSRAQVALGCREIGLLYSQGVSEQGPFNGRIMFPITDASGDIVGFSGRVLDDSSKAKYINSPDSIIFDKSNLLYSLTPPRVLLQESTDVREFWRDLTRQDEIFVVEGYTDVIALAGLGLRACAGMGTGFSQRQVQLLLQHSKRITCLYDGDAAGLKAAERTLLSVFPLLTDQHRLVARLLPDGHDPDSFIQVGAGDHLAALDGLPVRQPETVWWEHYVGQISRPPALADQVIIERAYASTDTYPQSPLWRLMIARRVQRVCGYVVRSPRHMMEMPPWAWNRHSGQSLPTDDPSIRLWLHRFFEQPDKIAAFCSSFRKRWWVRDLLTGRVGVEGPPKALAYIFAADVCLNTNEDQGSVNRSSFISALLDNGYPAHWLKSWVSVYAQMCREDVSHGDDSTTWEFEWSMWLTSLDESTTNRFKSALLARCPV